MNLIRMMVLGLAALACLGSASSKPYTAERVSAPPGVTDADLFAATYRVLTDLGYSIRDKDRDAGIVTTEWVRAGDVFPDTTILHAWRAVIEEGELRLSIDCETVDRRSATRASCGGPQRVESFAAKATELRSSIFREAELRAVKRRAAEPPAPAPQPAAPDEG